MFNGPRFNASPHNYLSVNVRFVPLADVDIYVPTHIEIVRLNIRTVVVAVVHDSKYLFQESLGLTIIMILIPVGINLIMARSVGLEPARNLIVAITTDAVAVADEIDTARLEVEHQSRVAADCK